MYCRSQHLYFSGWNESRSEAKASPKMGGEFLNPCGGVQVSCCLMPPTGSSHSKAKMGCDAGARCMQKKTSLRSGEVGIAWVVWLEPDPGSGGQRLLPPGLEPTEVAALPLPEELAEELRLLQELHLALDRALRWPPVLVEHRAAGCVIIQYGGGADHIHPNPVRSRREKGYRRVFTCRSARPNQNTKWSKTVSPLKSVLPWGA